jgi:hypothetical protein
MRAKRIAFDCVAMKRTGAAVARTKTARGAK